MKLCFILFCCLFGMLLAADVSVSWKHWRGGSAEDKLDYKKQPLRFWGSDGYPGDTGFGFGLLSLSNTKTTYVLYVEGKYTKGEWRNIRIGMKQPSEANFYHNSFLNFDIGGEKAEHFMFKIGDCRSGSGQGYAELNAISATGKEFTLRFLLNNDDDRLQMVFTPKSEEPYSLTLITYPGSLGGGFAAGEKLRKREMSTTAGSFGIGERILTKNEPWVILYDNYFDCEVNRGEGPCAVFFNPYVVTSAVCNIQNYACTIKISYIAGQKAEIILWDFHQWSNRAAKEYMRDMRYKINAN